MRAIPHLAVLIVAKWEGFREKAYLCAAGVPTIGFGHTKTVTADDVKNGRTITRMYAEDLLRADLEDAREKLYRGVATPMDSLTENQYAAMISFAYNVGWSNKWQIARYLLDGDLSRVPGEFMRFVYAGGKKLGGLVNRRADEIAMWQGTWKP